MSERDETGRGSTKSAITQRDDAGSTPAASTNKSGTYPADSDNGAHLVPSRAETYADRPGFEPPRNGRREVPTWTQCLQCKRWFAAPNKEVNRGRRKFCSWRCSGDHARETGKYRGQNNPRWLGGVSTDNMRYKRRQVERHPVETEARRLTARAIRSGALIRQACEVCGETKSEAHHPDYSKPLKVIWLCRACHRAEHRRLKSA